MHRAESAFRCFVFGIASESQAGNNTVTVNGKLLSDFQLQQTDVFQEKAKKMVGSCIHE